MHLDWMERAKKVDCSVRNFVNGEWRQQDTGESLKKYSPRDGSLLYEVASGGWKEIDEAVACARTAFEDRRWSGLPVQRWKDVLFKLAALVESNREELALLECLDVGKPITEALNFDVPATVAWLRFCAEAVDKHYGKVYAANRSNLSYELRQPVGVVAGIVGWNFPLFLAAQKVGPVLAAGNCLVLKPSEYTSLCTSRFAELACEAGVPPGVFNVVHGDGRVGAHLAQHNDVDQLTFTGSTQTGKALLNAAGQSNMKRLILECGGKAPNIVFDDAPDLAAVASAVLSSAFWNQGQVCVASTRLLVQQGVREKLLHHLIPQCMALAVGDPLDVDTKLGPVISGIHLRKVSDYIQTAEGEGATRIYSPTFKPPFNNGFYLQPQLLDDVQTHHQIAQEEVFGPVLSIISFADESEAIRIANDTIYGLSAVLWTQDFGRGHRVAQSIRAGSVIVNATAQPWGGPADGIMSVGGHKQSGIGVEGGLEGIEAYTAKTAVQYFV